MLIRPSRQGFTLIEMSIVIVVIGLVIGGVLLGKELIESAEKKKIISDIDSIKSAVTAFELKYNCLPGDCINQTQFFTMAADDGSNPQNGNGNNRYDTDREGILRFWETLGKSEIWPGNFTGQLSPVTTGGLASGVNTPDLSWLRKNIAQGTGVTGAAPGSKNWFAIVPIFDYPCYPNSNNGCEPSAGAMTYARSGTNRLMAMVVRSNATPWPWLIGGYTCAYLKEIDLKVDDGMPHTGMVKSIPSFYNWSNCSNWDGTVPLSPTTAYVTDSSGYRGSMLSFEMGM